MVEPAIVESNFCCTEGPSLPVKKDGVDFLCFFCRAAVNASHGSVSQMSEFLSSNCALKVQVESRG